MPATAAATIAAASVIGFGENHQPRWIKAKISGLNVRTGTAIGFLVRKYNPLTRPSATLSPSDGERDFALIPRHTCAADARFVAQLNRHAREQRVREVHFHAPARAFVGSGGA
jgi:hypothetical protein